MGLLDSALDHVLGESGRTPGGAAQQDGRGTSPLLMALLGLLASQVLGQGSKGSMLGGVLGGAGRHGDLLPASSGASSGGLLAGGLGGLVEALTRSGHGDTAASWVGHGPNRPIAPADLGDALGADTVDQLAQQSGMERQSMLDELSRVLPDLVDRLTPNGGLPDQGELDRY